MDFVFSFNKYKKSIFFSFLAVGFCPKNLAFAGKIMALHESGGGGSPLARMAVHRLKMHLIRR